MAETDPGTHPRNHEFHHTDYFLVGYLERTEPGISAERTHPYLHFAGTGHHPPALQGTDGVRRELPEADPCLTPGQDLHRSGCFL